MANSEMDYIHGYMADQTYDPTSMNAQSGIAVAEALGAKIGILSAAGNATTAFKIGGNSRMLIITCATGSGSDSRTSMGILASNNSGTVTFTEVRTGSNITYNTGTTGQLKITNNHGNAASVCALVFAGSFNYV